MTVSPSLADKLRDHAARNPMQLGSHSAPGIMIRTVPLEFRGQTGAYFRVWLVNVALSVMTLGLYLPWARIRMRQYFYGQTFLDNHNFSYSASPLSLLLGYLLVGGLFLTFSLSRNFEALTWISYALGALYFVLYPFLLYRSLRFQAYNTLHRGLRFGFGGSKMSSGAGGAYLFYGLMPFTYPLTMGLTLPLAQFLQRRYLVQNIRYGAAKGLFRGGAGPVYLAYLMTIGGLLLGGLLLGAGFVALVALKDSHKGSNWLETGPYIVLALLWMLVYLGAGQFIKAQLLRYTLEQSQLGATLRFRVRYRPLGLAWVLVSNLLAQVLTLGLATPWAAVRKNRYILSRIDVLTLLPLDEYRAATSHHEGALGEAAAELFDIGLHL